MNDISISSGHGTPNKIDSMEGLAQQQSKEIGHPMPISDALIHTASETASASSMLQNAVSKFQSTIQPASIYENMQSGTLAHAPSANGNDTASSCHDISHMAELLKVVPQQLSSHTGHNKFTTDTEIPTMPVLASDTPTLKDRHAQAASPTDSNLHKLYVLSNTDTGGILDNTQEIGHIHSEMDIQADILATTDRTTSTVETVNTQPMADIQTCSGHKPTIPSSQFVLQAGNVHQYDEYAQQVTATATHKQQSSTSANKADMAEMSEHSKSANSTQQHDINTSSRATLQLWDGTTIAEGSDSDSDIDGNGEDKPRLAQAPLQMQVDETHTDWMITP